MTKASKNSGRSSKKEEELKAALRRFIRANAEKYLRDPNVTSIGVGRKNNDPDGEISIVFTVGQKAEITALESLGTELLPETIEVEGFTVVTDVEERRYEKSYSVVEQEDTNFRKTRIDPLVPGVSVAHYSETAGTLGAIVYDEDTGAPCILSNWHVLHGNDGQIGDPVVQPGPYDDNDVAGNLAGELLRSHLGAAGDCALALVRDRTFAREIHDIGTVPRRMADVDLDDPVIKSGRTTGTTYGKVRRTDVMAQINYGFPAGLVTIGGFEIGVDPDHAPDNGEISMGGDSGSLWMIRKGKDATDIVAGLHFAGEAAGNDDEHALACYPLSVQKKLRFSFEAPPSPVGDADTEDAAVPRAGFDANFLGIRAPMPDMTLSMKRDAVNFGRAQTIPYTHFSVCLSAKQRLARFVAWNVDGAQKVVLGSHSFRTDSRIDRDVQTDNSLYSKNKLDRGHIARRADLAWGPVEEAKQSNKDSYFYTNIAPQHERFNQSKRAGIWGRLENLILEQAATQNIRISVIGGPIFGEDDPIYRGIAIPREYWKLVAYLNASDELAASCFILSQNDLLSDIETLDFDPFRLFQVTTEELGSRTGLGFAAYDEADVLAHPERVTQSGTAAPSAETLASEGSHEITGEDDLII